MHKACGNDQGDDCLAGTLGCACTEDQRCIDPSHECLSQRCVVRDPERDPSHADGGAPDGGRTGEQDAGRHDRGSALSDAGAPADAALENDADASTTSPDASATDAADSAAGSDAGEGDAGEGCLARDKLDLLLVLDTSESMREGRLALAGQLEDLFRALGTGDVDADGEQEFPGFRSVHAGVITSDIGAGPPGNNLVGCSQIGDDAALRSIGDATQLGCAASYSPAYAAFAPGPAANAQAAADLECIVRALPSGCGMEAPLEAALKAVSPETAPWAFTWTQGQASSANAGFLRPDAVLAVLVLSDEDDCSLLDLDLARPAAPRYRDLNLNVRCGLSPGALTPLSRYHDALRELKERPSDVVFATIAGVPVDLSVGAQPGDYDAILADPSMAVTLDVGGSGLPNIAPTCTSAFPLINAEPARRLVELVDRFGERGVARSVCADGIRPALRSVAAAIGRAQAEPDCSADACPCQAPFACQDGRCVCDPAPRCQPDNCDAVRDGCGGAHYCGGCLGTDVCAGTGLANQCGSDSDCPADHLCVELALETALQPTSIAVYAYVPAQTPDPLAPLGVLSTQDVAASGASFAAELDVTDLMNGSLSEVRIAIVASSLSDPSTPASGDEWYAHEQTLRLAPGASIDLGVVYAGLIAVTADDPATLGDDGEGVLDCNGARCDGECSDSTCAPPFSYPTGGGVARCDGPEDCGSGAACCFIEVEPGAQGITQRMECADSAACSERACHTSADCPASAGCTAVGWTSAGRCAP